MQRVNPDFILDGKCLVCGEGTNYREYMRNCEVCGWVNDDFQNEFHDLAECTNSLSFNQHKVIFQYYRSLNPNYIWLKHRFMKKYQVDWSEFAKKFDVIDDVNPQEIDINAFWNILKQKNEEKMAKGEE